jgi:hypothetical protein
MRQVLAVVAVLAVGVVVPAGADAPRSLGEVAAKEKQKKKGKVFTEEDLRRGGRSGGTVSQPAADATTEPTEGTPAPAATEDTPAAAEGAAAATATTEETKTEGAAPAGDKPAAEKPKTEDEERADREKEWREKLTQAQADVTTWTAEVNRLQSVLNDNTGPLYGPGRAARVESLENAKRQLAAANQTVETLTEEGRRNRYR